MADSNSTSSFYVYVHRRATDGSIFYVGKGIDNRSNESKSRNQHWKNIVKKHGYTIDFAQKDIQEWYAFELEKDLISYYGRENLCNKTDGGEGSSGLKHSKSSIQKMSISSTGKKHSLSTKQKMSDWQKTKKLTTEHKKKIADSNKKRVLSAESKLKNSLSQPSKKQVICIDTNQMFESIKEAARYFKIYASSIGKCCTNEYKQTQGMRFRYAA